MLKLLNKQINVEGQQMPLWCAFLGIVGSVIVSIFLIKALYFLVAIAAILDGTL